MKLGLVLEGGSRKVIFTAGVIDALMEQEIEFQYVIGVSAGAHAALNYVTGQKYRLNRVLRPSAVRKGQRAHILLDGIKAELKNMCYDYSYGLDPFDFKKFFTTEKECEIAMTCAESGEIEFKSERADEKRLLDCLSASCALPMLFNPVEIDGKHYFDGCVTDSIPFDRAFEKGCDKVLVVSTKVPGDEPIDFKKFKMLLAPMYEQSFPNFYNANLTRFENYGKQLEEMAAYEAAGKLLVLKPEHELCGLFETKPSMMDMTYHHGYMYTKKRMDELKAFLEIKD